MTITLTLLALSFLAGIAVLLISVLNAPEGYEDENGFHAKLGGQPQPVPVRAKVTPHQAAA